MKTIIILAITLLSLSSFADCNSKLGADNAQLVAGRCVAKDLILDSTVDVALINQLMDLERRIGNIYDFHYISEFRIYGILRGHMLLKRFIKLSQLEELIYFAVDELGIYEQDQIFEEYYDQLDVYNDAKELTRSELKKWFMNRLTETEWILDEEYFSVDEVTPYLPQINYRDSIMGQAVDNIVSLLFSGSNEEKVVIYPVLDNNNENVADAEWVIAGYSQMIIFNKRYWL